MHTMCSHAVRMPLWLVKIFVQQLRASAASPAKNGDRCPQFGLEGSLLTLLIDPGKIAAFNVLI
jgi:hypothetical protein